MPENEDRGYQLQVGGMALVKDGIYAGSFGAACCYANMAYRHVQGIWHASQNDAEIAAAMGECNARIAKRLIELGDAYGIATGQMTEADLELVKKAAGRKKPD